MMDFVLGLFVGLLLGMIYGYWQMLRVIRKLRR